MIATQAGISSDYVPVAERVNELNRATRAVRNLRAANLGLNEGLFDLAGGDASQTRRYQRAMEAAIARGAPIFGGRGGAGGGLGAAYGDMMEKAAAAKTPESLISKKGAEFVNVGTDPMNPQTQATMDIVSKFGREPTPQEMMTIGNQMAMLQRGFTQQEHPLAATPGMVASLESAEGAWYNPLNWFRDDTYYKGKTRSGKSFETGFGYNPYLEEAALGFRPPR
jgi:hypothetical protein